MGDLGSVRRAQVISTYGIGGLVATRESSVMMAGLEFWPTQIPNLDEPRLARRLRVRGFVEPPGGDEAPPLPVVRFPLMHHCPECRRLAPHWELADRDSMQCRDCAVQIVPSRFVVACEAGHIDDFPYMRWVHQGAQQGDSCRLTMTTSGASAALRSVVITCEGCGASRNLDGAFNAHELQKVARCFGKRPWLKDSVDCTHQLRALQRGASNVWFGEVRSALSIPPWSEAALNAISRHWQVLRLLEDPTQIRLILEGMGGAALLGADLDEIVQAIVARRNEEDGGLNDETDFRRQEYDAIRIGRADDGDDAEFVARKAAVDELVSPYISEVVLVDRLREVRALVGFSRLQSAGADAPERIAPLSASDTGVLPAIEVRGEGLYVGLSPDRVAVWETGDEVRTRVRELRRRHAEQDLGGDASSSIVTPRFVLLHTLAHALIDAFSLDAGYPAASLRERLYVSEDMAGLLIYTATSDSAGSLGGIVAQGHREAFRRVFLEALRRHAWCSADPVCIEATAQGVGGLNLAACHACVLLPETSCEHRNVFLDRGLLVGTPADPKVGFFEELVRSLG